MASGRIKPIRTEKDHEAALARIDALVDADPGSAEFDELDVLADLVELHESKHEPMALPARLRQTAQQKKRIPAKPRDRRESRYS